jgi:hypothetical protein
MPSETDGLRSLHFTTGHTHRPASGAPGDGRGGSLDGAGFGGCGDVEICGCAGNAGVVGVIGGAGQAGDATGGVGAIGWMGGIVIVGFAGAVKTGGVGAIGLDGKGGGRVEAAREIGDRAVERDQT